MNLEKTIGPSGRAVRCPRDPKTASSMRAGKANRNSRYFGALTAYVAGEEADGYVFTSALPVAVLKMLAPDIDSQYAGLPKPKILAIAETGAPSSYICFKHWTRCSLFSKRENPLDVSSARSLTNLHQRLPYVASPILR